MKKVNSFLYKGIGTVLILSVLCLLHYSYFPVLKYGHVPFVMFSMVFVGVYWILPYILDKLIISVGLALYTVYTVVQVCYCKLFDQYLFLSTALNLYEEAAAYTSDALDLVSMKEIIMIIVTVVVILMLCLVRKKSTKKIQVGLICIVFGSLLLISAYGLGMKREQMIIDLGNDVFVYNQTDRYLYYKISSKKNFVEYFGLETFLYRDIKDHYWINDAKAEEETAIIKEFLSSNLS